MSALLLSLAAAAAPASLVIAWDLEADDGGFLSTGETGQWKWGEVRNGPGAGYDGARAWSTGLTTAYLNDTTDYLEIPLPDLQALARPMLRFLHWYEIGEGDVGWIELETINGWNPVAPLYGYPSAEGFTGASGGWTPAIVDLAGPITGARLAFSADISGVASGWTVDAVGIFDGDIAAPYLSDLAQLADTEELDGPYPVSVIASDDTEVTGVTLRWSARGGPVTAVAMTLGDADRWWGTIPGQAPDTEIFYGVQATDGSNTAELPTTSFRVYLPAPTDVVAPTGRVVGTSVVLAWASPESIHPVVGYEVYRGHAPLMSVVEPVAEVPLLGAFDEFSVRARYDVPGLALGDPSETVVVDAVVPAPDALWPAEAFAGDEVRVRLSGRYLLLAQDAVSVSFGPGVEVVEVEVADVNTATVHLRIEGDAAVGARTVALDTRQYSLEIPGGFAVQPASERPRLLSVEPAWLRQGEEAELRIRWSGDLADVPTVSLGEGVVVQGVELDGDALRVRVACATNAPLGDHAIRADDGVRVYAGAALEVRDNVVATERTCGAAGGGFAGGPRGLWGIAALATLLRRRGELSARAPGGGARPR